MNGRKIQEDLTATRGELEALYFQLLQEITNPITVNFAANALQEVRQEIERNEQFVGYKSVK